ncbi:MAG: DNA primase [Clostridiales bacterium]|nr:DNA primase [Clostridiales bacterium]
MDKEFSEFISNVLDKTDIVSLISRYVKLNKKGNTYMACCPFHNEKTPSFSVVPDRQFFHCFGCGVGGNAISFVMKANNVEFIDALKMLAEEAGLEMPKRSGSYDDGMKKEDREKLYALMRDAARHYHDNLSDPRAGKFNDYIKERKLEGGIVRRFGLGASLSYDEMPNFLLKNGYTVEQMRLVGIAESKNGRVYDVFGERLMYPIIDNLGRVVAFGGRILEKTKTETRPKYRNSMQTVIFDKSNVLYGVNLLKKRKTQGPIDYVIMTEGYMDVIALHKAGFDTAVASMGTSLTVRHARQLKMYADTVYISYDGDTAGQKATMRGLEILRETGLTVKVVRIPDELDPDDIIKRDGPAGYQKLLDEAIPLTAYKIEVLRSKYNVEDPDERAKFAIEAAKTVVALDNPVEQEQYLHYVADVSGFAIEALRRQAALASSVAADAEQKPQPAKTDMTEAFDENVKKYLSFLLWGYDFVNYDVDVSNAMTDDFSQRLYWFCKKYGQQALKYCESEFYGDDVARINELVGYKFVGSDDKQMFDDVQRKVQIKALENEQKMYQERVKITNSLEDLKHLQDLVYKIQTLGSTK